MHEKLAASCSLSAFRANSNEHAKSKLASLTHSVRVIQRKLRHNQLGCWVNEVVAFLLDTRISKQGH